MSVPLRKGVLKIYSKVTGKHSCRSVISMKLLSNFIQITLRHGCSVNSLHILGTPFPRNTFEWLLLMFHIFFHNHIKLFLHQTLSQTFVFQIKAVANLKNKYFQLYISSNRDTFLVHLVSKVKMLNIKYQSMQKNCYISSILQREISTTQVEGVF